MLFYQGLAKLPAQSPLAQELVAMQASFSENPEEAFPAYFQSNLAGRIQWELDTIRATEEAAKKEQAELKKAKEEEAKRQREEQERVLKEQQEALKNKAQEERTDDRKEKKPRR